MSLSLPLRLANREVRRRRGRTLLVALLVALPVVGMALSVVLIRTDHRTEFEAWRASNGEADAVEAPLDPDVAVDLPEGSRVVRVVEGFLRVRTAEGERSDLDCTDLPLADPMADGVLDVLAGRGPTGPGEVALSPDVMRRLDAEVGQPLVLDRPALRLDVVGVVEQPTQLSRQVALFAPGQVPAELTDAGFGGRSLIDLPPLSHDQVAELSDQGLLLREVSAFGADVSSDKGVRWTLVLGAVALTVIGIVISAAFAVGARRQLVTLGQLSASGASPTTVRTALILQGTATGLLGTALGLGVAGALLLTLRGRFEGILDRRISTYEVGAIDLVAVALVGIGAATLAALIPARTAARIPTLAALAGRRPLAPVSRRLVAAGMVGMLLGLGLLGLAVLGSANGTSGDVWALVAIAGGVAELLGACAISPAIVARLEPLAGRVRGSWRLAARGLARNRSRTGAVVSAVAAAGALAIAATALVSGFDARDPRSIELPENVVSSREVVHGGDQLALDAVSLPREGLRTELDRILPGATTAVVEGLDAPLPPDVDPFAFGGWAVELPGTDGMASLGLQSAVVADEAVLETMGLDPGDRAALDRIGAVVAVSEGSDARGASTAVMPDGRPLPVTTVLVEHSAGRGVELLVTSERADELGLLRQPFALLYTLNDSLTGEQRDALDALQLDLGFGGGVPSDGYIADLDWYHPPSGPSPLQLELILAGVALVFSLFVVGASLALAAAESKDERDILTVAGAPPAALARAAGARAWLLAGIGGAMAVPVGYLPVMVYARAEDDGFPLIFPSRTVALLVLAVPTLVAVVALLSSATAQRLRPVRVSTATFE